MAGCNGAHTRPTHEAEQVDLYVLLASHDYIPRSYVKIN